jgi:hypothetical protein
MGYVKARQAMLSPKKAKQFNDGNLDKLLR